MFLHVAPKMDPKTVGFDACARNVNPCMQRAVDQEQVLARLMAAPDPETLHAHLPHVQVWFKTDSKSVQYSLNFLT